MCGSIFLILVYLISECVQHQFVPIIPKECEQEGYCEHVPNYPHEYVNKIIEQMDNIGYIWKSSNVSFYKAQKQLYNQVKPLCKSKEEVVPILAAKHRSGKWYFVIDKIQKFTVRICVNAEAACGTDLNINIELDTDANRTQCLQRYIEDFRLTIDENGVLGERLLRSAACCTCAVIANKRIKVQDIPP